MKWIYHKGDLLTPDEFAKISSEQQNTKGSTLPDIRQVERGRWIWDREAQELVPAEDYVPPELHHVIHDTIEPLINHADSKLYDSKRAMAKAHRRAGYVEVGNETEHLKHKAERARLRHARDEALKIEQVVAKSEHMLKEGYRPEPLPRVKGEKDIRGDAW